jgi:hypothetical protein
MNILKYFALPVGWFVGTVTVIAVGFAPDPYLEYVRQIPPPHPYPTSTVLWILLFMSIHVAVAFAILRPMSYTILGGAHSLPCYCHLASLYLRHLRRCTRHLHTLCTFGGYSHSCCLRWACLFGLESAPCVVDLRPTIHLTRTRHGPSINSTRLCCMPRADFIH